MIRKAIPPWRILVVGMLLLAIVQPAATRAAPETPAAPALADLLNPDGTLRLDGSFSGALDLEGWQVQLDPARGPLFAPAASLKWNNVGEIVDGVLGGVVNAIAVSVTDVYVGGAFTNVANIPEADCIAKWNNGVWSALGSTNPGIGALNYYVRAIVVSGTGVYVGGDFTDAANTAEADYVALWSGGRWHALGSNGSGNGALNGPVYAIAVSGTDVYVGGAFTNAANNARADYVAKWNGSAWSALGFNASGDGALNNFVSAIAVSGTDVYVGGGFTNAANIATADYVAKWNGSAWSALGSNGSGDGALNDRVSAIAVSGTDVYVGGRFTNAAGIAAADYVAKWNGSAWGALGSNGSGNGALNASVSAIAVSGTDVYVGGGFTDAAGSAEADYVAKWNGSAWSALGSNGSGDGALGNTVYALAVSGTDVYVGGAFRNAAGLAEADYIAKWDGSAWNAFALHGSWRNALNDEVSAIAVSGTDVYVGGSFTNAANIPEADYIAKWNGSTWSALGSNGSGNGALDRSVSAIAVSGTDVYVGGGFTNAAGIATADYVAKWNGSAWSALGSNGSGNGALGNSVGAIAVSGTNVYVGGWFTNAANIPEADYVAKWNGSAWSALGSNGSGNGALGIFVYALAVSGTDVVVGGLFTNAANIPEADYVAKWNGSAWSALGSNGSGNGALNNEVRAIAVSGTDVYVGGLFTNAAGIPEADRIAKWNGSAWSALGSNGSGDGALNGAVRAIAVSGTDVVVGGGFTNAAGIATADYIAKWNGSAWSALGSNISGDDGALNRWVNAVAVSGTDVYVGGGFTNAAYIDEADYVARWGYPAGATCTAQANGDWSNPATWSCGYVPGLGDKVVIPAGFTVTLDTDIELDGDLEVQGTLDPNGKTVTLTGNKPQTLKGSPPGMTFYNLVINKTNKTDTVTVDGKLRVTKKLTITKGKLKSASDYEDIEIGAGGELELTSDITVGGNFTILLGGTFTPNGFRTTFDGAKTQNVTLSAYADFEKVTVAAGTVLVEVDPSDSFYVTVDLVNNGVIQKTQTIGGTGVQYFGLAGRLNGADVALNVTTDNFTSITVQRRDQNHAGRTGSAPPGTGVGWGIYWTITPDGSGVANLTLPHALADHTQAKACRFISGTTWDCSRTSSTATTVTRDGVSTFSDWAVGNNVRPNAVTLHSVRVSSAAPWVVGMVGLLLAAIALRLTGFLHSILVYIKSGLV